MVYGYLLMGAFLVGTAVWGAKYYSETGGPPVPRPQSFTTETLEAGTEPAGVEPPDDVAAPVPGGGDGKQPKTTEKPPSVTSAPGGGAPGDGAPGGGAPGGGAPGGGAPGGGAPGGGAPTSTTATTTTKKKRGNKAGYVGNGWWSSDMYFGWEPNSYPGLSWGSGIKPPKRPSIPSASFGTFEAPPKLSITPSDWLGNLQKLFVEGRQPGEKNKGFAGWFFGYNITEKPITTTEPEPEYVSDYDAVVVTASKDHLKPPPGGWGVDYNPYFYFSG